MGLRNIFLQFQKKKKKIGRKHSKVLIEVQISWSLRLKALASFFFLIAVFLGTILKEMIDSFITSLIMNDSNKSVYQTDGHIVGSEKHKEYIAQISP